MLSFVVSNLLVMDFTITYLDSQSTFPSLCPSLFFLDFYGSIGVYKFSATQLLSCNLHVFLQENLTEKIRP